MKKYILITALLLGGFIYAQESDINIDGLALTEKRTDCEKYQRSDGTVILKYADRLEGTLPDGTKIVKYNAGVREISYKDGRKLRIDKPNAKRIYTDAKGKETVIDLRNKTPYGDPIDSIRVTIQKSQNGNPAAVISANFIPDRSDDILIDDYLRFFNEMIDSIKANFTEKTPYEGNNEIKVNFSLCRFNEYGYCFNKEKKISLEIMKNGKTVKLLSYETLDLRIKEKRILFLSEITAAVMAQVQ